MPDQAKEHKADIPIPVSLNHAERAKWRRGIAARPNISHPAYRIATVLEDMMSGDRNGEAYPSQDALSACTGISVRDLRRHTKALAKDGWIVVLDGKDRTRPKSKRGSHYRPMWPDEETKTRCMKNEFIQNSDDEGSIKTGGKSPVSKDSKSGQYCPVSDDVKTGHLTSQNRPTEVAKPASSGRSHRRDVGETERTTEGKPPQGGFPHQGSDINSDSRDALGLRRASPIGGDEEQVYSCDDLQEIELRDMAFATGPLPSFDGEETELPNSREGHFADHVISDDTADAEGDQRVHLAMLDEILNREHELGHGACADNYRRLAHSIRRRFEKLGAFDAAAENTIEDLHRRLPSSDVPIPFDHTDTHTAGRKNAHDPAV